MEMEIKYLKKLYVDDVTRKNKLLDKKTKVKKNSPVWKSRYSKKFFFKCMINER